MGCSASAGKNPSLDRIPSTTSTSDAKARDNGHVPHAKGNSNNSAQLPSKTSMGRRDTGNFNDGLVNNDPREKKHQHEGNSLIDLSSLKKHKDVPLSGPIYNNNKEVSKSQSDFFKMLDSKIEQGSNDFNDET